MECPVCPVKTCPHLQGMLYIPGVFKPGAFLTSQWNLETFLGWRHTALILCSNSALLMQLRVGLNKGQQSHRRWNLSRFVFLLRWTENLMDLSL